MTPADSDPAELTGETVLQRTSDLTIEISAVSDIELILDGDSFRGDHQTLAILDTFATAKTLATGLQELRSQRSNAPDRHLEHVSNLYEWGVLIRPDQQQPRLRSHVDWFNATPVHIKMLNDRARTASFQQAIRETVTPDDIVVDIGTGTGVLAITAAKAGARHVYAIEGGSIGRVARQNFVVNRLADRITLIEGRSTHIELPEKADVLVSEIIGNDPLDEAILETTADAVQRHLAPAARLIPRDLRIYGLPVAIPQRWLEQHIFTEDATDRWQSWYDQDFSILAATTRQQSHALYANTYETRDWPRISEPIRVAEIDLSATSPENIETRTTAQATAAGELNGIIVYFETRLSESVDFSIDPSRATVDNSWASKVWLAGRPVQLKAGESFQLSYCYGKEGSSFEIELAP